MYIRNVEDMVDDYFKKKSIKRELKEGNSNFTPSEDEDDEYVGIINEND